MPHQLSKEMIQKLTTLLPQDGSDAKMFVLDGEATYYYVADLTRKDGKTECSTDYYVHSGHIQDSVLIGKGDAWKFRFFPYKGNRLSFYDWDKESEPVYIYNFGSERLEVDCYAGNFLIEPGTVELLGVENTKAQIKDHIVPAIDRYTVWEAYVDDNGSVYYI